MMRLLNCGAGQRISDDYKSCVSCDPGQKLSRDKTTCVQDEIMVNADQTHFQCSSGFKVSDDKTSCVPDCALRQKLTDDGKSCVPDASVPYCFFNDLSRDRKSCINGGMVICDMPLSLKMDKASGYCAQSENAGSNGWGARMPLIRPPS